MFLLMQTLAADGTCLHGIQHRRNGTHIVLAQQQMEQGGKVLRIPHSFSQHIIKLLQGTNKDIPQLIQNLSAAVISGCIQFLSQICKPLFQLQLLQKCADCFHLLGQIPGIPESLEQLFQGQHRHAPRLIQLSKLLFHSRSPDAAESLRMIGPVFQPLCAANAPNNGIILHEIAGIGIQRGQHRAQIAQYRFLLKAFQRRLQTGKHRGDHALLQDIFRSGQIHRNSAPVECQFHQRFITRIVCADDGNIPVSVALSHKGQDLLRSSQTFLIGRICLAGPDAS